MRTHRLYCPQLPLLGETFELSAEQGNYVGKVLRLQLDDCLHVFDGHGKEYQASIQQAEHRKIVLKLLQPVANDRESPLNIELGQVISRGDRMDYAVQKSVELGVKMISPLFSARCEVKLNAMRQEKRQQHWQQIVFSACEQSGRAFTPTVNTPVDLETWLTKVTAELKLVLHPANPLNQDSAHQGLSSDKAPKRIAILIGPEGGFSDKEIAHCTDHGFRCLTLGPRILRTETAPIVALSFLQQCWGDFASC